jgi:hypothetical protein
LCDARTDIEADDLELMKDARVYFLADSFCLEDLKKFSLGRFRSKFAAFWANDKLADCIREIYECTRREDGGIRIAVIDTVKQHCKDLLLSQPFEKLVEAGEILHSIWFRY